MDSQAKYAVLAASGGDLLFRLLSPAKPDYRERIWDQAAGFTNLNTSRLAEAKSLGHIRDGFGQTAVVQIQRNMSEVWITGKLQSLLKRDLPGCR